jgi:hypothetical protein
VTSEARRARYYRDKVNGICVSCHCVLPDSWHRVHCRACSARQAAWQASHRELRAEAQRRSRARRAS